MVVKFLLKMCKLFKFIKNKVVLVILFFSKKLKMFLVFLRRDKLGVKRGS